MTQEILTGTIPGPYLVDDGDDVIVAEGAHLRADPEFGIRTDQMQDSHVSITVAGRVTAPGDHTGPGKRAISLWGIDDPLPDETRTWDEDAMNHVHVTQTGVVRARWAITLGRGAGNEVQNEGYIYGEIYGIFSDGNEAMLVNAGRIGGGATGTAMRSSGLDAYISNSGVINAFIGIWTFEGTGTRIVNSGKIHSDDWGLAASNADRVTMVNAGSILSDATGINSEGCNDLRIENAGSVIADTAVRLIGGATVVNTGTLRGESHGLRVEFDPSGQSAENHVTITNFGRIVGEGRSLVSHEISVRLENFGVIRGDIALYEDDTSPVADRVENTGTIHGRVDLATGDDIYHATGWGHTTGGVDGGAGDDRLTGGAARDEFRGGAGADVLQGGAGNDVLWGQGGRDRLDGGAGNDRLDGGGGPDVFVFALGGGQDRIADFGDGHDRLELDADLWTGARTAQQVVDDFAEVVNGRVVFAFDGGEMLTLDGVTTLTGLADQIVMV